MKGFVYFFKLWGRNIAGNFRFWSDLIKSKPLVGVLALVVALPLSVLSPVTAFLKTVVDYASRKSLSKKQVAKLKNTSIADRIDGLSSENIVDLANYLVGDKIENGYTKKHTLSTMSRSTQAILKEFRSKPIENTRAASTFISLSTAEATILAAPSSTSHGDAKTALKNYATNPKNANKGFFNALVEKTLELSVTDTDRSIDLAPAKSCFK